MLLKRIVVPTDLSASSLQALEFAAELARPAGAELVLLFAIEPIFHVPDYAGAPSAAVADLIEEEQRRARAELARLEQRYTQLGLTVRTLLLSGKPCEVIVDTAKQVNADLIVMATHGRSGVARLLMGSVTEGVVRTATCAVLTLRPGRDCVPRSLLRAGAFLVRCKDLTKQRSFSATSQARTTVADG